MQRELFYVRDGVLNQGAIDFNIPISSHVDYLHFLWWNSKADMIKSCPSEERKLIPITCIGRQKIGLKDQSGRIKNNRIVFREIALLRFFLSRKNT